MKGNNKMQSFKTINRLEDKDILHKDNLTISTHKEEFYWVTFE